MRISKKQVMQLVKEEMEKENIEELFGFGSSKGPEAVEDINMKVRDMLESAENSIQDMNRQAHAVGAVGAVVEQAILHAAGIKGGTEQRLRAMYERLGRAIEAQIRGNSQK